MENNEQEHITEVNTAPAPAPANSQTETPEDRKKANTLCVISLICMFAPGFLLTIFSVIMEGALSLDPTGIDPNSFNPLSVMMTIGTSISGLAEIAAWVLMIYVRVKYRKNTFGKVLMFLYIGLLILLIIGFILLVIMCVGIMKSCHGF
ncbi:MAG: hypothetical protein J5883_08735 [Clostridiales bacterium]|nr:hypothetical protein [Clostridiales bacterium]